jgi:hypothetical protein
VPEDVAEQDERRAPQTGGDDVEGDEAPERHLGRARQERRDGPHQADEAADQDGQAAAPGEEVLDLLQALGRHLDLAAVLDEELAAEPPTDEV